MKNIFYLMFLVIALFNMSFTQVKMCTEENIHYGNDSLQTMDISFVENRTKTTPLIILVHGGGWWAGDKTDANFMKTYLNKAGFNVVNINYRLNKDSIHYIDMMSDIDLAIKHVVANADNWNIRSSKYIMWGGSAGAHLSLLYAYSYDKDNIVSSVITLGAPTKLDGFAAMRKGSEPLGIEYSLPYVTGKPWVYNPKDLDEAYRIASPYYSSKFKPTLFVHGSADKVIPVEQSIIMDKKLNDAGVPSKLIILPNGGHGGENAPLEDTKKMYRCIDEWILTYSK